MMKADEFEGIYTKFYTKIYNYLKIRTRTIEDAEELAANVFLNFYKNINSYNEELCKLESWLFVITNNQLKNYYRNYKNEFLTDEIESSMTRYEASAEEAAFLQQLRADMILALQQLSYRERSIIVKKYYQGKSSKEIAADMHLTAGNVRVIAKRSLAKLKIKLNDIHGR